MRKIIDRPNFDLPKNNFAGSQLGKTSFWWVLLSLPPKLFGLWKNSNWSLRHD